MSKNHAKSKAAPIVAPVQRDAGTFTNSSGRTWPITGMSPLLPDRIRDGLKDSWSREGRPLPVLPQPPTYTTTVAGGDTATLPHNETTLETDADRAAWAVYTARRDAYRATMESFESAFEKQLLRAVALCVTVNPDEETEWAEEQEVLGILIPEKKAERRIAYVETQVIRDTHDILALMTAVMTLSGITDERTAAAAEKAFQSLLDERRESAADRGADAPAG